MTKQEFRALIKRTTARQKLIAIAELWESIKVVVDELANDAKAAKASKKPLPPIDLGSGRWN